MVRGFQGKIGMRIKQRGQNISQIISRKHFTTKESTSMHNYITQLILIAVIIIIRGGFQRFFFTKEGKRKTSYESNKNTREKEEKKG